MMNKPTANSRARQAYNQAIIHAYDSHDIWLNALDHIIRCLREAKIARSEKNYPLAFEKHRKVASVIMVLLHHLPEANAMQVGEPAYASTVFLRRFYDYIRRQLAVISAKPDAASRYDHLILLVSGLRHHLAGLHPRRPA